MSVDYEKNYQTNVRIFFRFTNFYRKEKENSLAETRVGPLIGVLSIGFLALSIIFTTFAKFSILGVLGIGICCYKWVNDNSVNKVFNK